MRKLQQALAALDRFEKGQFSRPSDAERLLVQVFEACGHPVTEKGFMESPAARNEVDCFIRTKIAGKLQNIAVEVKGGTRPAGVEAVSQAFNLKANGPFDRAMIVSRLGFSPGAVRHANTVGLGQIDLFGPGDLRNWLWKQVEPEDVEASYQRIVRYAMRQLAQLIAEHPEVLSSIEWRELEKVLREAFEEIGFDTKLTRPSKDGGFDLELTTTESGQRQTYLVEVKHWTEQKPGPSHLRKFVDVTALRQATAGLLLSTSGFTRTMYGGIFEFLTPVHLGEGDKVVSLCKIYYRLRSALWIEDTSLQDTLLSGTRAIGVQPRS